MKTLTKKLLSFKFLTLSTSVATSLAALLGAGIPLNARAEEASTPNPSVSQPSTNTTVAAKMTPTYAINPQVFGDLEIEAMDTSFRFMTLAFESLRAPYDPQKVFTAKMTPVFSYTTRDAQAAENTFVNTAIGDRAGTKSIDGGVNLTLLAHISPLWSVGGSFQYDYTDVKMTDVQYGNQEGHLHNIQFGFIAGYEHAGFNANRPNDRFYLHTAASYTVGIGSGDMTMDIDLSSNQIKGTVKSSPNTHVFRVGGEAGYNFAMQHGIELGPYAHFDVGIEAQNASSAETFLTINGKEIDDDLVKIDLKSTSYFVGNIEIGGRLKWKVFHSSQTAGTQKMNGQVVRVKSQTPNAGNALYKNLVIEAHAAWKGQMGTTERTTTLDGFSFDGNNIHLPNGLDPSIRTHDAPGLGGALWGLNLKSVYHGFMFDLSYNGTYASLGNSLSNGISFSMGMNF